MKRTLFGTMAGLVTGYMVKWWMDKKTFQEQDDLIATYEEMILDAEPSVDPDDVTRKYPPSLAWICDECNALMMFHDAPEKMQGHIDDIKDCDGLICIFCDGYNEIDPVTRHILNTPTPR